MEKFKGSAPLLISSNLGWEKPTKMLPIHEFASAIDKEKPEYVQLLKKQGQIFAIQDKYIYFTREYRDIYKQMKNDYV